MSDVNTSDNIVDGCC